MYIIKRVKYFKTWFVWAAQENQISQMILIGDQNDAKFGTIEIICLCMCGRKWKRDM